VKTRWTAADIPDLNGRTAIVTGASSGIGYEIAFQLAAHGAHVVIASRDQSRTEAAARQIKAAAPGGSVQAGRLDLADLASVHRFAREFSAAHRRLDILVNNAGVVGGRRRQTTDGFEAHFQVNYLGHFALTGLLLPVLRARPGSRVVTMSSEIASRARVDFGDLQGERDYRWLTAYAQSKLASLLFAFELDRRSAVAGAGMASLATHPGIARTSLLVGKEADWGRARRGESLVRFAQVVLGRPAATGALPALYQATDPSAASASYVGIPDIGRGYPTAAKIPPAALDPATAERLWEVSAKSTGVPYDGL
jgi:NAD(P)-dependent dehydrogenase (short-subunit alcohol dehydrogenase family)